MRPMHLFGHNFDHDYYFELLFIPGCNQSVTDSGGLGYFVKAHAGRDFGRRRDSGRGREVCQ